ncbi:EF-hand domain-containing protein [Sulfurimonas sp. HSL-1716]|uniref:EF-hand domain-containing protein n=1 Tax=Hydrocurvibacter sulfurireducens TaxID=3131937 RepID=UPI0031F8B76C
MKRLTIVSLVVCGSLMAAMGNNMPSFGDYDTNKDGKITQKEFNYERQERMKEKAEEGRMMRNAQNAPNFSDIDTNGDGVINKREFQIHQRNEMRNKKMQKNGMKKCSGQGMGPGMNQGMGQGMKKCSGQGMGPGMGQGKNR